MKKIFLLMVAVFLYAAGVLAQPLNISDGSLMNLLKGDRSSDPITLPFHTYLYAIQASTDEIMIPRQENNVWYDGGIYQDMQEHTWKPDNIIFHSAWKYCYDIIANCNSILNNDFSYNSDSQARVRLLRAYAYYRLLDLFGNVPVVTDNSIMPVSSPRAEVFAFIENELNDVIMANIPETGEINKGVLNMLKARLYLNSKVFLGLNDNSPEYQAYLNKAITFCDNIIASGVYSLESNVFANWYLDNGYGRSKEIIFAISYWGDGSGEGNELPVTTLTPAVAQVFRGIMYTSATSGWQVNPGKTADDPNALFNLFHPNDNRRLAILSGQLYNRDRYVNDGVFEKLTFGYWHQSDPFNPWGTPYATPDQHRIRQNVYANLAPWFENRGFNPDRNSVTENSYRAFGARLIKFELEENPSFWDSPVDMVIMRYAEVLYTKAEALIRLGRNDEAIPLFKQVLQHRGFDPMSSANYSKDYPFRDMDTDIYGNDKPSDAPDGLKISAVALQSKRWLTGRTTDLTNYMAIEPTLEFMEKEWRREFAFEDRRRTDMIRFDKYTTESWGMHEASNSEHLNLFPVPQAIINVQPNVKQNPGYSGYDGWLESSIETVLSDKLLQVYPNPTTGIVYLNTESNVKIFSLQGVQLLETKGSEVDLSAYPQGIYLLNADGKMAKVVKK